MSKEQVTLELRRAYEMTLKLLAGQPNDADLMSTKQALEQLSKIVSERWPLTQDEFRRANIGVFAIRILEGGPYGDLPEMLMRLSEHIRHGTP